jgi:hypothetical protein
MPLIILSGPSVPNPYGAIVSITNGKEGFGMDWTYQMIGGWYQGARSYTNTMIVVTNSPLVGPIQVQQALIGIGAVQGSTYLRPLPEYFASTGISNLAATATCCDRCSAIILRGHSILDVKAGDLVKRFDAPLDLCLDCSIAFGDWLSEPRQDATNRVRALLAIEEANGR